MTRKTRFDKSYQVQRSSGYALGSTKAGAGYSNIDHAWKNKLLDNRASALLELVSITSERLTLLICYRNQLSDSSAPEIQTIVDRVGAVEGMLERQIASVDRTIAALYQSRDALNQAVSESRDLWRFIR